MRLTRPLLALAAIAATLGAAPAASAAGPVPCGARAVSTPFAALGNTHDYWLLRGGDFEDRGLGGWLPTSTGVSLVPGNEPWFRTGRLDDAASVRIAPPASLRSPVFCIGPLENAFRFHYWSPARTGARLEVWASVRETRSTYRVALLPADQVAGWRTSPPVRLLELASFPEAHVTLAFRPLGAAYRIGDVFGDPFR